MTNSNLISPYGLVNAQLEVCGGVDEALTRASTAWLALKNVLCGVHYSYMTEEQNDNRYDTKTKKVIGDSLDHGKWMRVTL